jgi:hypothetical protein
MKNYKTISEKCSEEDLLKEEQFSNELPKEDKEWSQKYFKKFGKYPSEKILKAIAIGLESLKKVGK